MNATLTRPMTRRRARPLTGWDWHDGFQHAPAMTAEEWKGFVLFLMGATGDCDGVPVWEHVCRRCEHKRCPECEENACCVCVEDARSPALEFCDDTERRGTMGHPAQDSPLPASERDCADYPDPYLDPYVAAHEGCFDSEGLGDE